MRLRRILEVIIEIITNRHCGKCKYNEGMHCSSPKRTECISSVFPKGYEPKEPEPPVELQPCPFCGSKPFYNYYSLRGHTIGCDNPDCPIKPETRDYGTFELAERDWNTRFEN